MAIYLPGTPGERRWCLSWAEGVIGRRMPGYALSGDLPVVGVAREGVLAIVATYRQFYEGDAELIVAITDPRAVTRQVVQFVLGYPFWTFEIRRITAIVAKGNARSRRLCEGLGFAREGTLRDFLPHEHAIVYGMTRRWWARSRWHAELPAREQLEAA